MQLFFKEKQKVHCVILGTTIFFLEVSQILETMISGIKDHKIIMVLMIMRLCITFSKVQEVDLYISPDS